MCCLRFVLLLSQFVLRAVGHLWSVVSGLVCFHHSCELLYWHELQVMLAFRDTIRLGILPTSVLMTGRTYMLQQLHTVRESPVGWVGATRCGAVAATRHPQTSAGIGVAVQTVGRGARLALLRPLGT